MIVSSPEPVSSEESPHLKEANFQSVLERNKQTEETSSEPTLGPEWEKLTFLPTPADFVSFFNPDINSGKTTLYPWQVETLERLGTPASHKHPYKFALCACNGSGKDKFVIAPFAVWFILTKVRSRVIITSASGTQLSSQTEHYIKTLAAQVNRWALGVFGVPILKINQRYIYCLKSGSEIRMFATDEEGKAEGYHPWEDDSEMAIIVNEAKNVSPDIFRALRRCTGFSHWLNVSSPGEPMGDFFKSFDKWKENRKRVHHFDCPHRNQEEYEEDLKELGENDPYFRSKHLALFTFAGGKTVINSMAFERMLQKSYLDQIHWIKKTEPLRVGIDVALSTNGDKSVISAFKGNKQTHLIKHRIKDATVLADNLDKDLRDKLKLNRDHPINIDDGNVGRAVADIMRRMGWTNIRRVLNQSAPKNKKQFRNRGAEMWYKFSKLVEHNCLILLEDKDQKDQIRSRKYKESDAGVDRLTLQAKSEMFSEGLSSPDEADSTVLAWADCDVNKFIDDYDNFMMEISSSKTKLTEEEQFLALMQDQDYLATPPHLKRRPGTSQHSQFMLNRIIKRQQQNRKLLKWG